MTPICRACLVAFVCCTERKKRTMSHSAGGDSPANVQKYLKGIDYPAKKQQLVETAKKNGAPQEVVQVIQQIPNQEFNGPQDVVKAFGDMR
jgi:Protein of unknown function (DUF2795)